jgi:glutathione synthase/RimK-type ligase-like ATP-grasp enzyme
MNILILGDSSDAHAAHLHNALTQAGATVNYLNTRMFPTQLRMSWEPNTQMGTLKLSPENQLKFQDIHSVFWRSFAGVNVLPLEDTHQQTIALNDSMSALRTLMKACPARWVNSWEAYDFHKQKPLQLSQVKLIGVQIPKTLITNDPEQVIRFAKSYEKVIFKPVYGGAHTQILTESLLEPQRLDLALSFSPVTLQEYIGGTNIRSYVIGNSVYSAEIRSNFLDFREDVKAELIPVELPQAIQQQCQDIAKALYLEWTAIDWRQNCAGEYVFLEANPSPMFLHFERETGFPITQELVKLLMS